MRSHRRYILLGIPLAIAGGLIFWFALLQNLGSWAFVAFSWHSNLPTPAHLREARQRVLAMGPFAAYPVPDNAVHAQILGSAFTRQFIVEFEADPARVEAWFRQSRGFQGLAWPAPGAEWKQHLPAVGPKGGLGTEVWISGERRRVRLDWSWS